MIPVSGLPLVKIQDTLKTALDVIRQFGERTALVVNDKSELVGILTEGDIAKQAIEVILDKAIVLHYMNPNPFSFSNAVGCKEVAQAFVEQGHLLIALVNELGVLQGAYSVRECVAEIIQD